MRPGDAAERAAFEQLQSEFAESYPGLVEDPDLPRTVVVLPSLSLDQAELAKIPGVVHYEERLLSLLMLLVLPSTQVIYLSSQEIDPAIIDYYLTLLPPQIAEDARSRLDMIAVGDGSLVPLTQKLLERPELLEQLEKTIRHPSAAHITCFNATSLELSLAVRLGIPLYAPDPRLAQLGTKSAGRAALRDAGLHVPHGHEDLWSVEDVADAIIELRGAAPDHEAVIVKLDEGFSGEGNAILGVSGLERAVRRDVVRALRSELRCVAESETPEGFLEKVTTMGAIVEIKVAGRRLRSPSVQMRIGPGGAIDTVSTHDQVMGGLEGHVFLGASFPADPEYRADLNRAGRTLAEHLRGHGVIGRFAADFVSVHDGLGWHHHAIEINLRKGGTTLPNQMLIALTGGTYDHDSGRFTTAHGRERAYVASDNVVHERFRGAPPEAILAAAEFESIGWDSRVEGGSILHLLGAAPGSGKIGMVSVAETVAEAQRLAERATESLAAALASRADLISL